MAAASPAVPPAPPARNAHRAAFGTRTIRFGASRHGRGARLLELRIPADRARCGAVTRERSGPNSRRVAPGGEKAHRPAFADTCGTRSGTVRVAGATFGGANDLLACAARWRLHSAGT